MIKKSKYVIAIVSLFLIQILNSCTEDPVTEIESCDLNLTGEFSYNVNESLRVSTQIGLWMFCEQNLSENSIADWIDRPFEGKRLLEPINVIWIDFDASDEDNAQEHVISYLNSCGFDSEDAFHSGPYHAKYQTLWMSQNQIPPTTETCGLNNKPAWTDADFPQPNNHGRIFPAYPIANGGFLTLGAFSREGSALSGHEFISFDEARDKLDREVDGWSRGDRSIINIGNSFPPQLNCSFTTSNTHSGIRVFTKLPIIGCDTISYPNAVQWKLENGGNGHLYEVVFTGSQINWEDANAAANARGGGWHLATITSAAENNFVESLFSSNPSIFNCCHYPVPLGRIAYGPWLGAKSSTNTSNDWTWVTGEPFVYADWGPYEPFGNGNRIAYCQFGTSQLLAWNDMPSVYSMMPLAYILECSANGK